MLAHARAGPPSPRLAGTLVAVKLTHSHVGWGAVLLGGLLFGAPLLMNEALPWGSDARFHSQLAQGLWDGLADGHLYPRWISEANRGYGSPALVHYSPLGSYWTALWAWPMGDIFAGMRAGIILSAILAGFAFYWAARAFAEPTPAALGGVLYVLFPYHAIDLYERFALAEYHAFIFVPLVFRFACDLSRRSSASALVGFALSYALLLLTHVLMAYMCLFLLLPFVVLVSPSDRRPRALGALLGGGLLALALAGVYFVPLIVERSLTHADHLLASQLTRYERNFVMIDEVARGFGRSRVKPYVNTALVLQALPVVVAALVLPRRWNMGWVFVTLCGVSILLQTVLATPLYALIPGMSVIGFPWRFQLFQAFFGLLAVVWALRTSAPGWAWAAIGITAALALNLSWQVTRTRPYVLDSARFQQQEGMAWVQKEHIPRGVPEWKRFSNPKYVVWEERTVVLDGAMEVEELEWSSQLRRVSITSAEGGRLAIRTFDYEGWSATRNGAPLAIEREPLYGAISVVVPPGDHELRFELLGTAARRFGGILSMVTAISILGLGLWRWRNRAAAVLALLLIGCGGGDEPVAPDADPTSRRVVEEGALVGFATEEGTHAWKGIPFARPPIGPLRWRAPLPPEPWEGTREAMEYGASCVQLAGMGAGTNGAEEGAPTGSEDCLYLNVFAPRFAADEVPTGERRLPVMFWIHGGGNSVGDARLYDGSLIVRSNDLIVVSVHYRLGVLGWFTHADLRASAGNAADRSGNYGTLDLVRGLEWVRDNISAFGGDPDRVTIFGESAGGQNVIGLLLTRPARGLFHRAISQSGGTWSNTIAEAENRIDEAVPGKSLSSTELLLRHLIRDGRAADREAAVDAVSGMGPGEVDGYLRAKSAHDLLRVIDGKGMGGMYPSPAWIRDGEVVASAPPLEVFADASQYNAVPLILGSNRDEDKLFMLFSSPAVTRVFGLPLWLNDERLYDLTARYSSQMWKVTGVDEPAAVMRIAQGPSVWAYRFDWDEEPKILFSDYGKMLGAAHAIEIPFVFGRLSLGPATRFVFDESKREENEGLSRRMMSYWAELAYSGDPGRGRDGAGLRWEPWSGAGEGRGPFILFDSDSGGGIRLSREVVDREGVIRAIEADPAFHDWEERCVIYRSFVRWSERMDEQEYAEVGEGACRPYPLETGA